ncbi:cell growth-regulating nucleolar protein-like [Ciona intestinalis]
MVFFTCNGCGESLKKNKVDRHAYSCRNCEYLTCIDCSKDFWGDDYINHTSCITEDEKYSASGFVAKPNKGEVKQQEWIKKITCAASTLTNQNSEVKKVLTQLLNYENIPRKRGKFLNFLGNSLRIRNPSISEEVWNIFSAVKTSNETPPATNKKEDNPLPICDNQDAKNETIKRKRDEANPKFKKSKKQKLEVVNEVSQVSCVNIDGNDVPNKKFPWNKAIRTCLKAEEDRQLSIKKLKKKVLREYQAFKGDASKSENELNVLFEKKIKKNPKLFVKKNKVKLL